ncbi:hypothetical protein VTO42DRAFT_2922 [Malbranchea cinnamomea]
MEDTKQLKVAFDNAQEFLNPVLKRDQILRSRGDSLIDILSRNLPESRVQQYESPRNAVINYSLRLLVSIHHAFVDPNTNRQDDVITLGSGNGQGSLIEDAKRRRTLHALLDLLAFEGIYPCLSPGVGIPLEKRMISILPAGVVAKQTPAEPGDKSHSDHLLQRILDILQSILNDSRASIQPLIRNRILPDIICAAAELAYNSQGLSRGESEKYENIFIRIVTETSTPTLLPILSSFVQASSASWFKTHISSHLSRIPLRNDGVFQTILFIASRFAPTLGHDAETRPSSGPPITVQAIMHISRLLSSVPQGMSADDYFTNISPKLLALLDGEDQDLKKTASYVIGNGILSKRSYGASGTIGYSIFIEPIFHAIQPEWGKFSNTWLRRFFPDGSPAADEPKISQSDSILVDRWHLSLALDRLSALVLSHPNPALLKRLIGPILLPLWGLLCYANEHGRRSLAEKLSSLIQTFFSVSAPSSRFITLASNVLFDGGQSSRYTLSEEDGISIIKRDSAMLERIDLDRTIERLDRRIDELVKLLAVDPQREEVTGDVFLHASKKWLLGSSAKQPGVAKLEEFPEDDYLQLLIAEKLLPAKITEKLLSSFKDTLSRHPLKVLELIHQLIESEHDCVSVRKNERRSLDIPSIDSLAHIAGEEGGPPSTDREETSESLSAAFSLLSTILTSPEFTMSQSVRPILETTKSKLDSLLPSLPQSLVQSATTSSMLLEITLSGAVVPESQQVTAGISSHVSDLQTHRQALSNISSPLPPVQAEGLLQLSKLIEKSSPVLDIPAILSLLISMIITNDETKSTDEFVYLNVIKVIGLLASRHPRSVIKTLAERYADRSEEATVDQRLKIGEALLRTIQELGGALVGDAAKVLGETMVSIAGRREQKPKAKKEREKRARQAIREIRDEKNDPPRQINKLGEVEDDSETEDPARAAYSQKILDSWAAGAAGDESPDDLRVRTSALSILASAIQTNLAGVGCSVASSAVDLALSTLTHEPGPESAILRRAAVVVLLDIVKALDTARENGSELCFGFSFISTPGSQGPTTSTADNGTAIGNVPEILRVVQYAESKETDAIVRGHIRVLIENLEAWMENYLLWGIRARDGHRDNEPRFELGDQIAGLDIQPLSTSDRANRPRIEEVE